MINNYDNSRVRRQDRLLDIDRAEQILRHGEYGFLSMTDCNGGGYGVPVNYVWDNDAIYLHCAPEGDKIRALNANPSVSFCVVGATNVVSDRFTAEYESVLVRGKAVVEQNDERRMRALELIIDKYSPNDKVTGLKYAQKSLHRTAVIRIDIDSVSGKSKSLHNG